MDKILLSISAAAVITVIFRIAMPDERYNKQMRLIISCFFIVVVINMLSNNIELNKIENILKYENNYLDFDDTYKRQTADEIANNMRVDLYERLNQEKINPEKIYIDVNISENDSISISKIKLVFVDMKTDEAERAVKIAGEFYGNKIIVELEEQ